MSLQNLHRQRASPADSPCPSFQAIDRQGYHRGGFQSERDAPELRDVSLLSYAILHSFSPPSSSNDVTYLSVVPVSLLMYV
jgi:hypothetical protein